jgi:hypothetical protein
MDDVCFSTTLEELGADAFRTEIFVVVVAEVGLLFPDTVRLLLIFKKWIDRLDWRLEGGGGGGGGAPAWPSPGTSSSGGGDTIEAT